eukprot:6131240-Pyramimonas_sp.AAC.1
MAAESGASLREHQSAFDCLFAGCSEFVGLDVGELRARFLLFAGSASEAAQAGAGGGECRCSDRTADGKVCGTAWPTAKT